MLKIEGNISDREHCVRVLYETLLLKKLSPETAAQFIGCSGNQVRRWIGRGDTPSVPYVKMIYAGVRKIHFEFPGDPNQGGVVSWGTPAFATPKTWDPEVDKKLNVFFVELMTAAREVGHKFSPQNDEDLSGFENIVHLAAKLKIKLPKI